MSDKTRGEGLIGNLDGLLAELNRIRAHLDTEASEIGEQWEQLGRMGAQRADHAAQLLGKLRPHLYGLECFARRCVEQLDAIHFDPFDRKTEPEIPQPTGPNLA